VSQQWRKWHLTSVAEGKKGSDVLVRSDNGELAVVLTSPSCRGKQRSSWRCNETNDFSGVLNI